MNLPLKRIAQRLAQSEDSENDEEISGGTSPTQPDAFDKQEHRDEEAIHTAQSGQSESDEEAQGKIDSEMDEKRLRERAIVSTLEKGGYRLAEEGAKVMINDDGSIDAWLEGIIDVEHILWLSRLGLGTKVTVQPHSTLELQVTFQP